MDDHHQDPPNHVVPESDQRTEPVRSRWTPKPEQILILESIFNSGMVNPPKEETVRIRKLLEKFGTVGDANVFYWFQNRRSRSRRRQRQIQASLNAAAGVPQEAQPRGGGSGIQNNHPYDSSANSASSCDGGFLGGLNYPMSSSATSCYVGSGTSSSSSSSSSSCGLGLSGLGHEDGSGYLYNSFQGHQGFQEIDHNSTIFGASNDSSSSTMNYQPGVITVFINGVATEVGRGPLDMKAMFGGDFMLYHSSGVPVQVNEYGFLVQSLQHGESYFLVPKPT